MRLLFDAAALIRLADDPPSVPRRVLDAYRAADNRKFVSVVTMWEIIVKHRLGKLPLRGSIDEFFAPLRASSTVTILPLPESGVLRLRSLPSVHQDPFDRMLICQALDEGLTIVTPDRAIASYPVDVL